MMAASGSQARCAPDFPLGYMADRQPGRYMARVLARHRPAASPTVLAAVFLFLGANACRGSHGTEATAGRLNPEPVPLPEPPSATRTPIPVPSPASRTEEERNTIAVFRDAAASTVFVTQKRVLVDYLAGTAEEVAAGFGSGFVWDKAGHVVTNFHVVKDAQALWVTFGNQQIFEARIVGVDPRKDIAVIKIEAPEALLVPVRVSHHVSLDVGQKAIAIGNPFGLDHTLTVGIISALGRQVQGIGGVAIRDMIQTDAAINPGN